MIRRLRLNAYKLVVWLRGRLRPSWTTLKHMPNRINLFVLRTAVRIFPFIPTDRDKLHPPTRLCPLTAEWISAVGKDMHASLTKVDAPYTIFNPLPKTVHKSVRQQFVNDQTYVCPQTFVATIPRGRVTRRGLVITPDGQLLEDVSVYFETAGRKMMSYVAMEWSPKELDIKGKAVVLSTDAGSLYYHWLFQLLPRYELLRRAGIEHSEIDHFVVSSQRQAFQRESLGLLGIDRDKIVASDRTPIIRAEEMIVPSVPLGVGCFRPWMMEFLRLTFLPHEMRGPRSPGRRLYISRANASYRRVLNESDVVRLLHSRGFETIAMEALTMQEQAAAMASCEIVVAPHGGGLSNIVFCSPGTKIIEIFSPELVASYFWKIANQVGLDYYYLLGKGPAAALEPDYVQSWNASTNIEVDLEALQQTLALAEIK